MHKKSFFPYILILPATLALGFVSIYPFFRGLQLSLTNTDLIYLKDFKYVGFNNYIKLFTSDNEFWTVLIFTLIFVLGTVLISYAIGLLLASLLNQDIRGRTLFRALLLLPWVMPSIVAAKSWLWLLNDQFGFINMVLLNLHIIESPILFLANQTTVKITVVLVSVWKSFPFMTVVLLAGLQSIPEELYESAAMDGAGWWTVFTRIKLPLLTPVTFVSTILLSIWTFNNFDTIYLLTKGGPGYASEVISILTYYTAFFRNRFGYACTIAVVMVLLLTILTQIYIKTLRRDEA